MEKIYVIYKITNLINNKIYIGKHETCNVNDNYMGSGKLIVAAIKKYGVSSFKKEILHIYSSYEEAANKEKEIVNIEFLNSKISYNLRVGGDGGNTSIMKTKEEKNEIAKKAYLSKVKNNKLKDSSDVRQRKSIASKIRVEKMPNSIPKNKGRIHTGSALENIRLASKNRIGKFIWINNGIVEDQHPKDDDIPDGFTIGRLKSPFKGRKHTDESRNKIRNNITGDIVYNNGSINIKIKDGDIIPEGFSKGMIQVHKKFKWINNGREERKFFFEEEHQIPDGWLEGRVYKKRNKSDVL